jgi:hypothetical protein
MEPYTYLLLDQSIPAIIYTYVDLGLGPLATRALCHRTAPTLAGAGPGFNSCLPGDLEFSPSQLTSIRFSSRIEKPGSWTGPVPFSRCCCCPFYSQVGLKNLNAEISARTHTHGAQTDRQTTLPGIHKKYPRITSKSQKTQTQKQEKSLNEICNNAHDKIIVM